MRSVRVATRTGHDVGRDGSRGDGRRDGRALLVVLQSGAAILALSRPVPAWWLSTLALFLARTAGETKVSHAPLWSWSVPGIALHALVLFLLALRVRPRVAVEALGLTLLVGLAAWAFVGRPPSSRAVLQDAVT